MGGYQAEAKEGRKGRRKKDESKRIVTVFVKPWKGTCEVKQEVI